MDGRGWLSVIRQLLAQGHLLPDPDGHGGLVRNSLNLPTYGGGCRGAHVQLADLNGDGRDEIVATFVDEPGDRCSSGGGITAWKSIDRQP